MWYREKDLEALQEAVQIVEKESSNLYKAERKEARETMKLTCQSTIDTFQDANRQRFLPKTHSGLSIDIWGIVLGRFCAGLQENPQQIEAVAYDICNAMLICKDIWQAGETALRKLATYCRKEDTQKFDRFLEDPANTRTPELKAMSKERKLSQSFPRSVLIVNLLNSFGVCGPSRIPACLLMDVYDLKQAKAKEAEQVARYRARRYGTGKYAKKVSCRTKKAHERQEQLHAVYLQVTSERKSRKANALIQAQT